MTRCKQRAERKEARRAQRAARRADRRAERQQGARLRLYRIPQAGRIAGVCAGLADYFGISRVFVRLGWIVSSFAFFSFMIPMYLVLWLVLPTRPETLYQDDAEEVFWSEVKKTPKTSISNLHHRFQALDRRLQDMETEVTSAHYRFDQEMKKEP